MGNSIVEGVESENDSVANLLYTIITEIGLAIKEVDREVYKESGCRIVRRQEFDNHPDKVFREYLETGLVEKWNLSVWYGNIGKDKVYRISYAHEE